MEREFRSRLGACCVAHSVVAPVEQVVLAEALRSLSCSIIQLAFLQGSHTGYQYQFPKLSGLRLGFQSASLQQLVNRSSPLLLQRLPT